MSACKNRKTWWVAFRYRGKRYRLRSPENSQAGALAFEAVLRHRLAIGEPVEPPTATTAAPAPVPLYADFAREWLETYVRTNNKPSEQRTKNYRMRRHLVPFFGKMTLAAIGDIDIERYKSVKTQSGLAPKSVNNHLAILSKSLNSARDWGLLERTPRIKFLRVPPQRFDFLTPEESRALLDAARTESAWHDMILCALRTGLRVGELLGLEWRDVDMTRRQLIISRSVVDGHVGSPKNNRVRMVPLSLDLAAALSARGRSRVSVFDTAEGRPVTYKTAHAALKRICKKAGLRRVGWHTLRHTFASQLAAAAVPMRAVQDLLGHSTLQMTMRYSHLAPSALHEAVNVLTALHDGAARTDGQRVASGGEAVPLLAA